MVLKKWLLRIFAGVIIVFLGLIMTAPAQLVQDQLNSRVSGLKVTGATAGLWSGQFQNIYYRGVEVEKFAWNLSLVSLLTAKLGAELTIDDPLFRGDLFVEQGFSGRTSLSDINGKQSIIALSSLWPLVELLKPTGSLHWDDVSLSLTEQTFEQANGQIEWRNAALTFYGKQLLLGKITLQPTIDNGDLLFALSSDSVLGLEGKLHIKRNNTYQLSASISEDLPSDLGNALKLIAQTKLDQKGRKRLVISIPGRW